MLKLTVYITLPNGKREYCGDIFTTQPDKRGIIEGSFRYAKSYLDNKHAFPLDPENLPLSLQDQSTSRKEGVHSVFEDALPDDWGRALLIRKANLSRPDQTIPKMLGVLGSNGLGALSFESKNKLEYKELSADIYQLDDLVDTSMKFDAGHPVEHENLVKLYACGSTPGGARPKALVKKKSESLWIAKFPKETDSFHVESIEGATLYLARQSGISVADFEIVEASNRKILLVKRFDVSEKSGRYHMISMQSLLNAEGYYYLSYNDLFEKILKYSFQPIKDVELLYRQMIFNFAIRNTDDHLKNFCMLHKKSGFCLSPAYDILPDITSKREHVLSFPMGLSAYMINKDTLKKIGENYNIQNPDQIIDDVYFAVSAWKEIFHKFEVPDKEIKNLEQSIESRLTSLTGSPLP